MQESRVNSDVIAKSETSSLIASSKVEGTPVYNSRGDSLGSICDLMIDKRTGKVAYVRMSFGGFLGLGQNYHSLQWEGLEYDWRQGGYVVNAETERLLSGASQSAGEYDLGRKIDAYFGIDRNPSH
ncbi:MAG: PRC-barrel domain-containing protein [Methylocella sp.]